jgi:hypothetical protein
MPDRRQKIAFAEMRDIWAERLSMQRSYAANP